MANKVILAGNVGLDPEFRPSGDKSAMLKIRLATTEHYPDHTGTEWHDVVFFNRKAEVLHKRIKKGTWIYIEGKLQTRKRQVNNIDVFFTEILGSFFEFMDKRERDTTGQLRGSHDDD